MVVLRGQCVDRGSCNVRHCCKLILEQLTRCRNADDCGWPAAEREQTGEAAKAKSGVKFAALECKSVTSVIPQLEQATPLFETPAA